MDTESESELAVATQVNVAYLARLHHNRLQRTSIEPFKRALQQVLEPADVRVLHEIDDNH